MTPIFRKGKRQDVYNYRPISIVPPIYDQFYKYLMTTIFYPTVIPALDHLIEHLRPCLRLLTVALAVNIDDSLINSVIFIDLKKAFDVIIDHKILKARVKLYYECSSTI